MSRPSRNWRWGAWFAGILLGVVLLVAGSLHLAVRVRARRAVERCVVAVDIDLLMESSEYVRGHPRECLDYAVDEMGKAGSPRRERLVALVQFSVFLISSPHDSSVLRLNPYLQAILDVVAKRGQFSTDEKVLGEMLHAEVQWREMRDKYPISFNPW